MSQEAFAGRAAILIKDQLAANAEVADASVWQRAAEDCVLMRIKTLRLVGGLPKHKAPLDARDRVRRLQDLLRLWAKGCTCVVDEDLFADIVNRRQS